MKNRFCLSALGAAILGLAASAAQASPIMLTSNLSGDLGNGTHTGVFNGNGLLPANFQINSASYSFLFSDDLADVMGSTSRYLSNGSTNYSQVGYYYNGNYNYSYLRNLTAYYEVQRTGEAESVSVSLAGTNIGSGTTALSQSAGVDNVYNGRSFDYQTGYNGYGYSCGNRCSGWAPGSWQSYYSDNYTETRTYTQDWSGDFGVSGQLQDLSLLSGLLSSGELQYQLLVGGDLRLLNATLTLDITELEPATVPEPGSLALVAAAVGGLIYSRRRRPAAT